MNVRGLARPSVVSFVLLVGIGIFVGLPVLAILRRAFTVDGRLTWDVMARALDQPGLNGALLNTVVVVVFAGVMSVACGFILAVGASFVEGGRLTQRLLKLGPLLPLTVPALVGALGWIFLFSPRTGWGNIGIRNLFRSSADEGPFDVFSLLGVSIVTALYVVPYVFAVFAAALARTNVEALEASLVSGVRPWRMLLGLPFGLLRPAFLAASTVAVVQSLSLFSVPLLFNVDVLTTYIYRNANALGRADVASAIAVPVMMIGILFTLAQVRLMSQGARFVTVTGKGKIGSAVPVGKGINRALKLFAAAYLAVSTVAPLGAVALVSFLPFWKPRFARNEMTLSNYSVLFENRQIQNGLRNSLFLATLCSIVAVLAAFVVIVMAQRFTSRVAKATYLAANAPLGIPAVILGLGFAIAFIEPPIMLYGTRVLLVIAYFIAFIPIAMRSIGPVVQQIGSELEEAAAVAGSTQLGSFARVTLPLALPGIASAATLLFIIIFREFPIASFTATPGVNIISVSLLNAFETGRAPTAAAISMAICAVSVAGVLAISFLSSRVRTRT